MDLETISNALDSAVNRASKTQVRKLKTQQKKQSEAKKVPPKKEDNEKKTKTRAFGDLADIVNLRKQKAVANELEEFIFEQEERKKERDKGKGTKGTNKSPPPLNPAQVFFMNNPDKIKDLSFDDAIKLSLFTGSGNSGSYDPFSMMMMMGFNNQNNGKEDINSEITKMLVKKALGDSEQKNGGGGEWIKIMALMMQQQQQMIMNLMASNNNGNHNESRDNPVMKEMMKLIQGYNDMQKNMLLDKISKLEYQAAGQDPLAEAKRIMDYVKSFKSFWGGQNSSPEYLKHEREMKRMEFDQNRQLKEEELKESRMSQIGDIINKGIGTFADALSKPTAEILKGKLNEISQKGMKLSDIPQEKLRTEIDLGDLNLEEEPLTLVEPIAPPPVEMPKKSRRFEVFEKV